MRLATVVLVTIVLLAAGCSVIDEIGSEKVRGSGTVTSEIVQISDFAALVVAGEGTAIVTIGVEPSLTITTDDNLQQHIVARVVGSTLEISTDEGIDLDPTDGVTYAIGVPELAAVELSGAGSVTSARIATDVFTATLSGAGDLVIAALEAESIVVTLSGAGAIRVAGSVADQDTTISGAGEYEAGALASSSAVIKISGVGGATVWVEDHLDADLSGVGNLEYFGSPAVTSDVSGIGGITNLGDK